MYIPYLIPYAVHLSNCEKYFSITWSVFHPKTKINIVLICKYTNILYDTLSPNTGNGMKYVLIK